MDQKRSIGVTLFGIFYVVMAVRELFSSLLKGPQIPMDILGTGCSILQLVLGIYILRLKEWARKGIIFYQIFMMLVPAVLIVPDIIKFWKHLGEGVWGMMFFLIPAFSIVCGGIQIFFFTRPSVKAQFQGNVK